MSKKDQKPTRQDGELSEQQLDKIAGGQEVRKLEPVLVTAKRQQPQPEVVKLGKIEVTARREKPNLAGTQLASADASKKN